MQNEVMLSEVVDGVLGLAVADTSKLVALALVRLAKGGERVCVTNASIAHHLSWPVSKWNRHGRKGMIEQSQKVQRAVRDLEAKGLLKVDRPKESANVYILAPLYAACRRVAAVPYLVPVDSMPKLQKGPMPVEAEDLGEGEEDNQEVAPEDLERPVVAPAELPPVTAELLAKYHWMAYAPTTRKNKKGEVVHVPGTKGVRESGSWEDMQASIRKHESYDCPCLLYRLTDEGEGAPPDKKCPGKKGHHAISPGYIDVGARGNRGVRGIDCLWLDLDKITTEQMQGVRDRLKELGLAALYYGTHGDTDDVRSFRVVVPLSKSVPRASWPKVWTEAKELLAPGLVDTQCKALSQLYFLPGGWSTTSSLEGKSLNVDRLMELANRKLKVGVVKLKTESVRVEKVKAPKGSRRYLLDGVFNGVISRFGRNVPAGEGIRDRSMYSGACHAFELGASWDISRAEVLEICMRWNDGWETPLSEGIVKKNVRNAMRYRQRDDKAREAGAIRAPYASRLKPVDKLGAMGIGPLARAG